MRKKIVPALIYLELILVSLAVLMVVVWIVMSSFNQGDSLATTSLIPEKLTFDNYVNLFTNTDYPLWFMNTLKIAVINTVLSVFMVMVTAWIMSRFQFKGKKFGLMTLLLMSMFPSFLSMTALYTLFLALGLVGEPISLVIIYSAGAIPYNTWLVKGYLDGIPKAIDEAAYIDGCGRFKSFFYMILPLSKSIITYCAVSQFMMPWMDYALPNLLLSGDENRTLAVGLFMLIDGKENSYFTTFAAGAVLISVPIIIVFFLFQKYLVQGVAAGANKG